MSSQIDQQTEVSLELHSQQIGGGSVEVDIIVSSRHGHELGDKEKSIQSQTNVPQEYLDLKQSYHVRNNQDANSSIDNHPSFATEQEA